MHYITSPLKSCGDLVQETQTNLSYYSLLWFRYF